MANSTGFSSTPCHVHAWLLKGFVLCTVLSIPCNINRILNSANDSWLQNIISLSNLYRAWNTHFTTFRISFNKQLKTTNTRLRSNQGVRLHGMSNRKDTRTEQLFGMGNKQDFSASSCFYKGREEDFLCTWLKMVHRYNQEKFLLSHTFPQKKRLHTLLHNFQFDLSVARSHSGFLQMRKILSTLYSFIFAVSGLHFKVADFIVLFNF